MRAEDLFKRLKREYVKLKLIQALLETGILIMGFNAVRMITGLPIVSLGVAAVFFPVRFWMLYREYSVEMYEDAAQGLEERLRTARDNEDRTGAAVQALFDEIVERSRKIDPEKTPLSGNQGVKLAVFTGLIALNVGVGLFQVSGLGVTGIPGLSGLSVDGVLPSQPGSSVLGEPTNLSSTGGNVSVNVEGGESFSEGLERGVEEEALSYEKAPSRIEGDRELALRYSKAIRGLE